MLFAKALVGPTHFDFVLSMEMIFNIAKSGETYRNV